MSEDVEVKHHPEFEWIAQLQPEPKRLWLEALRSDRFRQGKSYLAQVEDGVTKHCCLGVLCEVAIEAGVDIERKQRRTLPVNDLTGYDYDGCMSMPPEAVTLWAYGTDVGVYSAVIEEEVEMSFTAAEVVAKAVEFTALNDDREWSFEQIAQAIEDSL
jgi:hypothetical protein